MCIRDRYNDLKTVYLDMHYKFLFIDNQDRDCLLYTSSRSRKKKLRRQKRSRSRKKKFRRQKRRQSRKKSPGILGRYWSRKKSPGRSKRYWRKRLDSPGSLQGRSGPAPEGGRAGGRAGCLVSYGMGFRCEQEPLSGISGRQSEGNADAAGERKSGLKFQKA